MDPTTLTPSGWAPVAGVAIAVLLRVGQARLDPTLAGLGARRGLVTAGFTLAGVAAGVAVAVATGNPSALLALDPNAVSLAVVDVLAALAPVGVAAVVPTKDGRP